MRKNTAEKITENKAVRGKLFVYFRPYFRIRDEVFIFVNGLFVDYKIQIERKSRVMFRISGNGDVFFNVILAVFFCKIVNYLLLRFNASVRGIKFNVYPFVR